MAQTAFFKSAIEINKLITLAFYSYINKFCNQYTILKDIDIIKIIKRERIGQTKKASALRVRLVGKNGDALQTNRPRLTKNEFAERHYAMARLLTFTKKQNNRFKAIGLYGRLLPFKNARFAGG